MKTRLVERLGLNEDSKQFYKLQLGILFNLIGFFTIFTLILGCRKFVPLSAPEEVEIYGRRFILETTLNRDFMPGCPPNGYPLIAIILVTAIDSLEFPSTIDADRLWIIKGEDVWETEFSNETIPPEPHHRHQLEKVARNGPKWDPGIQVDVVVRIIDCKDNKYFLKASNQLIDWSCK
jgi:hypothetical protein